MRFKSQRKLLKLEDARERKGLSLRLSGQTVTLPLMLQFSHRTFSIPFTFYLVENEAQAGLGRNRITINQANATEEVNFRKQQHK